MKTKIILEAIRLFEQNGIKFTLSELASEMAISKKTVYKYFGSKEELLKQAVDYVFMDIDRQHREIIAMDIGLVDKLKQVLRVYPGIINISSENITKIQELSPELFAYINYHYTINWEIALDLFEQCVREGLLRDIPADCFRVTMIGLYDNLLQFDNHREMLDICIDFVFRGMETTYSER